MLAEPRQGDGKIVLIAMRRRLLERELHQWKAGLWNVRPASAKARNWLTRRPKTRADEYAPSEAGRSDSQSHAGRLDPGKGGVPTRTGTRMHIRYVQLRKFGLSRASEGTSRDERAQAGVSGVSARPRLGDSAGRRASRLKSMQEGSSSLGASSE